MQNPVTLRFIEAYQYLAKESKVNSARQFALSLDFYPQSFNDILKGRREATIELLRKAIVKYDLDAQYLFTGVGSIERKESINQISSDDNLKTPLVLVKDRSEYAEHVDSQLYINGLSQISVYYPPGKGYEFRAFEVANDDLKPSMVKGEMLVCRKMKPQDWSTKILDGFIYTFVTDHGVVIERVLNFLNDNGTVILKSNLAEVNSQETLSINEIKEVWEVRLRITPDVPNPNNQKYRTDQRLNDVSSILEKQSESISSLHVTINRLLKQNRVIR